MESKKEQPNGWWIPAGLIVCGVTLLAVGPAAYWWNQDAIENWVHSRDFDPEVWRAQEGLGTGDWPPRLCMVDDLIESNILNGMSEAEVVSLLGPPSFREPTSYLVYYTGLQRGFLRLDKETLHVNLDEDGYVSGYWISIG